MVFQPVDQPGDGPLEDKTVEELEAEERLHKLLDEAEAQQEPELSDAERLAAAGLELTDEQKAEVEGLVAPPEPGEVPDGQPVIVAFLTFQDTTGRWVATSDLTIKLLPQRAAEMNDFYIGAVVVARDVTSAETANRVIMTQGQMMANAQKAAQDAQILEQLNNKAGMPGMPRSGVAPGRGLLGPRG